MKKLLSWASRWFPDLEDNDQLNNYISKSAVGTMGLQVALMFFSFLTSFLLARFLGKEDYGHYAYIITWFGLLTTTGSLGFDDLLVKEVPRYTNDKKWGLLRGVIRFSFWGSLAGNILLALIFWVFVSWTPEEAIQLNSSNFLWIIWALPAYATSFVFMAALQSNQMVLASQWPDRIGRPFLFVVGICVFFFLIPAEGRLLAVVQWLTFTYLLLFLFYGIYYWFKMGRAIPKTNKLNFEFKAWSRHLVFFFLLPLLNYLSKRIDFLLLGDLGYLADLGVYNVAAKLTDLITFPVVILNFVVSPFYSKYYHSGQLRRLQQLLTRAIRLVFILALPIFGILVISGYWLLSIWGTDFSTGYVSLLFLSFSQLFYVFIGPVLYVLMMCGFGKDTFVALLGILVLTTLIEWLLIPIYGMNGAAFGRMISMIIGHLYYGYLLYSKLGIYPSVFGRIGKKKNDA